MKKVLSILLVMLMLTSPCISGYAAADDDLTTELILDRLIKGDEAAETASDQAANGALRLAEMVVALDNLNIETQGEADHLNKILDKLAEIDVPEESLEHKLGMGTMKTFEALVFFQQHTDPTGKSSIFLTVSSQTTRRQPTLSSRLSTAFITAYSLRL